MSPAAAPGNDLELKEKEPVPCQGKVSGKGVPELSDIAPALPAAHAVSRVLRDTQLPHRHSNSELPDAA